MVDVNGTMIESVTELKLDVLRLLNLRKRLLDLRKRSSQSEIWISSCLDLGKSLEMGGSMF